MIKESNVQKAVIIPKEIAKKLFKKIGHWAGCSKGQMNVASKMK